MRDVRPNGKDSDLIHVFQILVNSSNCNKAIQLDGDLGLASIVFKYELSCANMSTCQPVPNTSLAACSKTSKTGIQMSFTMNTCMYGCVLEQEINSLS